MLLGLAAAIVGYTTKTRWLTVGGLVWAGAAAAQIVYILVTRPPALPVSAGGKVLPFQVPHGENGMLA